MRTLIAAVTLAITPGSPDRGARRLVGGGPETDPEHVYYTGDHYASFCEVDENS